MGVASDVIRDRLAECSFPIVTVLTESEVGEQLEVLADARAARGWRTSSEFDGSDASLSEISQRIAEEAWEQRDAVFVWPSYRFGIVAPLVDGIRLLGDVWYPGADDLWILGSIQAVLLDHEERVTVFVRT